MSILSLFSLVANKAVRLVDSGLVVKADE